MKNNLLPLAIFIIIIGVLVYLFVWQKNEKEVSEADVVEQPAKSNDYLDLRREIEVPEIRYPVPDTQAPVQGEAVEAEQRLLQPVVTTEPLPALDKSDDAIRSAIASLLDPQLLGDLFLFKSFVRHFVVTIDNMTGRKLPQRYVFTQRPVGKFMIKQDASENKLLDPNNYERYSKFVQFADLIDIRKLVSVYVRYYPLFQGSYENLGYPDRYFNDRFIEVIDHLLITPIIQGPITLEQPKVFYTFADPELEALSAGQKILIRIGPDNAMKTKTKLKALRQILTSLAPKN